MTAIEVRGLGVKYRQGQPGAVTALEGVTLSVQSGEFVSVLGRAGSGKTTLLQCLGLVLRPTSGLVVLDGTGSGSSSATATCSRA